MCLTERNPQMNLIADCNPFDSIECFKLTISKLLGFGIVFGASILKLPQIYLIINKQSAKGVSLVSYLLETISYSIAICYNLRYLKPISTFGEAILITIQNLIIIALIFSYNKQFNLLFFTNLLFLFIFYAIYSSSTDLLGILQTSTIILGIASKLPQILDNYSSKSVGNLSIITVFLQFAGSVARIFTTIVQVKDFIILSGFVVATCLNGLVFLQCLGYKSVKGGKKSKKKE